MTNYNVYLDVAAIITLAVILGFSFLQNTKPSVHKKRFYVLAFVLTFNIFADIAAGITCNYSEYLPVWLNMLTNSLLFLGEVALAMSFLLYVESFVERTIWITRINVFNHILTCIYILLLIINYFTGFIFHMDSEKHYTQGPYYLLVYLLCIFIFTCGDLILFKNYNNLGKRERLSMMLFTPFMLIGAIVQAFVLPSCLIIMFAATQSIIVLYFLFETPDYQRLNDTMEQLEREKEAADAASNAKSSFLANMSHEIRTPINAVLGMDEMILRKSKEPQTKEYALDIRSAAGTLLSIINDLLDMSKIEEGRMELTPVNYDLSSLIYDAVNVIKGRIESAGLELKLSISPNLPYKLYGDDIRLKQVINNLLTNAVKYTKTGYIELKMDGKIDNDILHLYVSIVDTGIGIKQEDMYKLFEKFQRIDEKRNRNIEGTGLGISITSNLLHLMDSKLEVKSEYGVGSTFSFTVKQGIVSNEKIGELEERIKKQTRSYEYNKSFTAEGATVLVVDDNAMNIKVLRSILEDTKMTIHEAKSGEECLRKTLFTKYDLILLDDMMPGMTGSETLQKLRELQDNTNVNTPVVCLTANAVKGAKERYLSQGFNGYLSKSVSPQKLEKTLEDMLPEDKVVITAGVEEVWSRDSEVMLPELPEFDWDYSRMILSDNAVIFSTLKDMYLSIDDVKQRYLNWLVDIEDNDAMNSFRIDVHALKSNTRMIGQLAISGLARAAEKAASEYRVDEVKCLIPIIVESLESMKQDLDPIFWKDDNENKELIPRELLLEKLGKLKTDLQERDYDGMDEVIEEISFYSFPDEINNYMHNLVNMVNNLDIIGAINCLDGFISLC